MTKKKRRTKEELANTGDGQYNREPYLLPTSGSPLSNGRGLWIWGTKRVPRLIGLIAPLVGPGLPFSKSRGPWKKITNIQGSGFNLQSTKHILVSIIDRQITTIRSDSGPGASNVCLGITKVFFDNSGQLFICVVQHFLVRSAHTVTYYCASLWRKSL